MPTRNAKPQLSLKGSLFAGLTALSILTASVSPAVLSQSAAAQTGPYLPTFKYDSADLVTPTNAWIYYQGQGVTSPSGSADRDARVKELARALRYDADLIYEHVRNYVDTEPMFGLQKGAIGALLDETNNVLEIMRTTKGNCNVQYTISDGNGNTDTATVYSLFDNSGSCDPFCL